MLPALLDAPFISTRTLAVGWYMARRLAITVLLPGGILTALALRVASWTAPDFRILAAWYCMLGITIGGCMATDYFAGRWVEREYDQALPGSIWWGVAWRTGLAAIGSAGTVALSIAVYPLATLWAWVLAGTLAVAGLWGTLLVLGWSTARLAHRQLRHAGPAGTDRQPEWFADGGETTRALQAFREAGQGAPAEPHPRAGFGPRPAPAAAGGHPPAPPDQPRGEDSIRQREVVPPSPPPPAEPVPPAPTPARRYERPVRVPDGVFGTTLSQNIVGGWEIEISFGPRAVDGLPAPAEGRVVFRSDRKPRPRGVPKGGFYSRGMAEEFAKWKIEDGVELLKVNELLRRAPRYWLRGGLPALLEPGGVATLRDLSLAGACAECQGPLRHGQEVALAAELPSGRFHASAQVVWIVPLPAEPTPDPVAARFRYGIRFLALPPEDLQSLQAYLAGR